MKTLARTIAGSLLVALSCGLLAAGGLAADAGQGLVLEKVIPLENVSGRIDHMAVDLERRRLAVAELGNDAVDLVDLSAGRVVHRIGGLREPQGVAYVPSADLFAVASAGDGSVQFFRARDLAQTGRVDLGSDADNIRVDARTGDVVVGYGEGGLAVVDPATPAKIADIALQAHPEGFQLTLDGRRAFVNLPDARQVASVDLVSGKQTAAWKTPDLRSNFPMAIDGSGRTLAVSFRGPPRLVLLDAGSGAVIADVETCGDADDVFFDDRRQKIYVSCGAGAVDVFDRNDGRLRRLARVRTYPGARTALFVPELDRLFVASRAASAGNDAKLLVFRPSP
jgi:DNA-binding beta-propeller fold protein YncE